ncbi:MAG: hypothetical protein LC749_15060 [Actinobacteria bacterium]|nr:hypothetical protein [Actinomycetota bacterium]
MRTAVMVSSRPRRAALAAWLGRVALGGRPSANRVIDVLGPGAERNVGAEQQRAEVVAIVPVGRGIDPSAEHLAD